MKVATIYFDGACLPFNPGGTATYGFIIVINNNGFLDCIEENGVVCEKGGTNNVAEYTALIKALEKAIEEQVDSIKIYGDSQLVVRQINGFYAVRSPRLFPLYEKVMELLKHFRKWKIGWIPRENNKEADNLSTKAFLDYMESINRAKTERLKHCKILKLSDEKWQCGKYIVDISQPSCSCKYFEKINNAFLLKRDNIIVKCKHIIFVEDYLKR